MKPAHRERDPATMAALLDMATTIRFMRELGPSAELHPVIRMVCAVLGPVAGPVVGKLCQFIAAVVVAVYLRRHARLILFAAAMLYAAAAWYNLHDGAWIP